MPEKKVTLTDPVVRDDAQQMEVSIITIHEDRIDCRVSFFNVDAEGIKTGYRDLDKIAIITETLPEVAALEQAIIEHLQAAGDSSGNKLDAGTISDSEK